MDSEMDALKEKEVNKEFWNENPEEPAHWWVAAE